MNDYLVTKELYHHGIKGQKWGVRRYQNEDGTLTEAGRKRVTNHLGKNNYVIGVDNKVYDANSKGYSYIYTAKEYSKYKKSIKKADSILKKLNKEKIDILYENKSTKDGREYVRYALIDSDDPSNSFKNIKKSNIYELEITED